jgi:uncharacterized protein YndB with AHSA1/START domain
VVGGPGGGSVSPAAEVPLLEASVEIDTPPARVWELVSDLPRMASWSPMVLHTVVLGGPVRLGTHAVNVNRRGLMVWPTRSTVVRFEPERELAFRVAENHMVWSFSLTPLEDGTRTHVVQRREPGEGITRLSRTFIGTFLGGQSDFTDDLRVGMRQTLDRLKAEAEAG